MNATDVYTKISATLSDLHPNPQIDLSGDISHIIFADLQLDSLDILTLAMELEDAFNIEIEITDLPRDASLASLSEFIAKLEQ